MLFSKQHYHVAVRTTQVSFLKVEDHQLAEHTDAELVKLQLIIATDTSSRHARKLLLVDVSDIRQPVIKTHEFINIL